MRVCDYCHRLPLKAGGCRINCAKSSMINFAVASSLLPIAMEGLREDSQFKIDIGERIKETKENVKSFREESIKELKRRLCV